MKITRTLEGRPAGSIGAELTFDEVMAMVGSAVAIAIGEDPARFGSRTFALHPTAADIGDGSEPFFTIQMSPLTPEPARVGSEL
jgi:hypothetical protein